MADDGHRTSVGDYVTLVRGTTYKGELVGNPGPALLGLGSIEPGGGFRINNYKTYGGDCPDELMLVPGDLYASLKGATKDAQMIGSVARVPPSVSSGRLTQDTVKLVFRQPDPNDASYLYWVLRTPHYRNYCAGHAMGSAVVALSRRDFLSYPVPAPTPEKRRVAALLDAIEEKIELNRQMSETLEAMARAIFRSWFVDFDPLRAKIARYNTGLPKELADLFPDSLEDSELGKVPKGWQIRAIADVCENVFSGGTPSTASPDYWGGGIPWLSSGETRDKFIITTEKTITSEGASKSSTRRARAGSTVIAGAGQGHTRGQTSMLMFDSYINQSVVALEADTRKISDAYLFFDLERRYEQFRQISDGHSSRGSLTTKLLAGLQLILPNKVIIEAFDETAVPVLNKIAHSLKESKALSDLRDALLPKLITGQLRIKDAEKFIEKML